MPCNKGQGYVAGQPFASASETLQYKIRVFVNPRGLCEGIRSVSHGLPQPSQQNPRNQDGIIWGRSWGGPCCLMA